MKSGSERSPSVFAVVVTWNQREVTLDCLASLHRATYSNLRLIVVDKVQ
jgi:GT2 family glycosyltransferase